MIFQAKKYSNINHQSLSKLVERFFSILPPTVKSLLGIMKMDNNVNIKDEYTEYLSKKYR